MRVLIHTSTFPLQPDDGLPRFVQDLATALSAGCQVSVLAPSAPGAADEERWGEVEIRRFPYFWPRGWQRLAYGHGMSANLRASWLARLQPPAYLLAQRHALAQLVREREIEVVNSHWIVPQGLSAAWLRGRSARFGHVVTLHGGDAYLLQRIPGSRRLARYICARSDALLAVSSNVRAALDATLGRDSGAGLQPMGVHTDRFQPGSPDEPTDPAFPEGYLLYVGRLLEIKGVTHLLQALPAVLARHPGLGLRVVGYGEREEALKAEARQLGIAGSVRFEGARPHAEIGRLFRGCRAAVVPSIRRPDGRAEGMPTVVLEALASGTRLVATATGGIPDVLRHRENGWLCPDADPAALAAGILEALDDPEDSGLCERARATAEGFDWTRVASHYRDVFESARPR